MNLLILVCMLLMPLISVRLAFGIIDDQLKLQATVISLGKKYFEDFHINPVPIKYDQSLKTTDQTLETEKLDALHRLQLVTIAIEGAIKRRRITTAQLGLIFLINIAMIVGVILLPTK